MAEKLARIRPRRHDLISQGVQLILSLPLDLKQETRDDLNQALGRYSEPATWWFVMLNPEQQRLVLKAVNQGARPHATLRVWNAAISRLHYGSGEIMASRKVLAEDAGIHPDEVSRALNRLADIGALNRLSRGRFAINPFVGWAGNLSQREEATKTRRGLRVVQES